MVEGISVKFNPVRINVPPHEPEYQYHCDPVPKTPPFLLIAVAEPIHIVGGFIDIESAYTEFVFKIIIALTHVVVLHDPCART